MNDSLSTAKQAPAEEQSNDKFSLVWSYTMCLKNITLVNWC